MKAISPPSSPLAERLAALSDPLRLRLSRLLAMQELNVGEIAQVVQLPQSTVSRHLKVLTAAGWLARRSEGPTTYYRLEPDDLPEDAARLWAAVAEQAERESSLAEDRRRVEAVLAERRLDSASYFSRVAGEWDEIRADLFGRDITGRALLGLLPPHWTVADLGCGTGTVAELLAPFVARVEAVDQSAAMLEAARLRLAPYPHIRCLEAPLEALPLADASVDAAAAVLVLHHVADPPAVLAEMRRILRPGGVALVVDMVEHRRQAYRAAMGHRHLGFAPETLAARLTDVGFVEPRITLLPVDPHARGPGLFLARATAGGL